MSEQDTMIAAPQPQPEPAAKRLYMGAQLLHNAALQAYSGAIFTGQPHLIEAKRLDALATLEGQLDAQEVYVRRSWDF